MQEKTHPPHWIEWYLNQPHSQLKTIRNKILVACRITPSIFNNWRYGYTPIPPLAQEKLNSIAEMQLDFTTVDRPKKKPQSITAINKIQTTKN